MCLFSWIPASAGTTEKAFFDFANTSTLGSVAAKILKGIEAGAGFFKNLR
jgi:hypothetical protein